MAKYKIGYTQGVYDMFHIGHLNILNSAKERCEYLIVGINSDSLVESYKMKKPVINEKERCTIVSNIRSVDECHVVDTLDKIAMFNRFHFDAVFIGDDWKGDPRWQKTQVEMNGLGVDVVFLPHTDGISSTILRPKSGESVNEM